VISSVKIEGNCAVMLYDKENFVGDSKVLTSSAPCLVGNGEHADYFNDNVNSFKVASLYMDAKNSPVTTTVSDHLGNNFEREVGHKWVSSEDYANSMVVVKNVPYVLLEDGTVAKFKTVFDSNTGEANAYPTNLDSRMNYAGDLEYANAGLSNAKACKECEADITKSRDECAKFECKAFGSATTERGGITQVDGATVRCTGDKCQGETMKWAFNGLTARLTTPQTTLDDATTYDVVISYHGQEVFTTLRGDQLTKKVGTERSSLTGTAANTALDSTSIAADGSYDGCKVTLFEECDYKGTFHTYYPGHYPDSPKALEIGSLQIEGNCKVRLYDLADFGGVEHEYGINQKCFGGSLLEEFLTPIYEFTTINGVYQKKQVGAEKQVSTGTKKSLRVVSLDFDHFDYPTPYPTTFPTASPTFDLDMPACPVSCTYHEFAKDGKAFNNHKIHVTHNKAKLAAFNNFRATYPYDEGKGPLKGGHTCWHEMPNGLDELQVYNTIKDGKMVTVNRDAAGTIDGRNHDDKIFKSADSEGGCVCRCN